MQVFASKYMTLKLHFPGRGGRGYRGREEQRGGRRRGQGRGEGEGRSRGRTSSGRKRTATCTGRKREKEEGVEEGEGEEVKGNWREKEAQFRRTTLFSSACIFSWLGPCKTTQKRPFFAEKRPKSRFGLLLSER